MQVKCPYCNHEVEALQYCEICAKKIDWIIGFYEKSQYYYNKGYGHAVLRELSLAIPNLEKAIYYNKYNSIYHLQRQIVLLYIFLINYILHLYDYNL